MELATRSRKWVSCDANARPFRVKKDWAKRGLISYDRTGVKEQNRNFLRNTLRADKERTNLVGHIRVALLCRWILRSPDEFGNDFGRHEPTLVAWRNVGPAVAAFGERKLLNQTAVGFCLQTGAGWSETQPL